MHIHIGLDVGAVSVKAAALLSRTLAQAALQRAGRDSEFRILPAATDPTLVAITAQPARTRGRPLEAARQALAGLIALFDAADVGSLVVTGSGGSTGSAPGERIRAS